MTMRRFACTRKIPVGGTARNPVYETQTIYVNALTASDAAVTVADYQAEEKKRLWGQYGHGKD